MRHSKGVLTVAVAGILAAPAAFCATAGVLPVDAPAAAAPAAVLASGMPLPDVLVAALAAFVGMVMVMRRNRGAQVKRRSNAAPAESESAQRQQVG